MDHWSLSNAVWECKGTYLADLVVSKEGPAGRDDESPWKSLKLRDKPDRMRGSCSRESAARSGTHLCPDPSQGFTTADGTSYKG